MARSTRSRRLPSTTTTSSLPSANDDQPGDGNSGGKSVGLKKRARGDTTDAIAKDEVGTKAAKTTKIRGKKTTEEGASSKASAKTRKREGPNTPKKNVRKSAGSKSSDEDSVASTNSKGKKKKSPSKKQDHQRVTERDLLTKLWNSDMAKSNGSYTFKVASWNVAGLRALLRKSPNALSELCKKHDLDMLCLQETKIQESHVEDPKVAGNLLVDDGYDAYYSCSTAKKGYSGTAVFVKRHGKKEKQTTLNHYFGMKSSQKGENDKIGESPEVSVSAEKLTPTDVSYKLGKEIDNEGRTIIVDFPFGTFVNVYVPNSGQTLQRLSYRTDEWDKFFLEFIKKKRSDRKLPIMWLGDLNVAHTALEVWNDGAKHLDKQAGVTPQERASFQEQLDAGFIDAFRKLHPSAKGQYSYWSLRAGNREPNKGLRLDYFICSPDMFSEESEVIVRDSYILVDQEGSDHCPVVIELEIKGD